MVFAGKGAGEKLLESIGSAKRTVKIASPFLNANTIRKNLIPAKNRGVKVTIITREDQDKDVLEVLKNFESFRTNELHAKFYIIDDKIMYEGSANFTYAGLFKSIEQMSQSRDGRKVSEAIKSFDRIKKECRHFKAKDAGVGRRRPRSRKMLSIAMGLIAVMVLMAMWDVPDYISKNAGTLAEDLGIKKPGPETIDPPKEPSGEKKSGFDEFVLSDGLNQKLCYRFSGRAYSESASENCNENAVTVEVASVSDCFELEGHKVKTLHSGRGTESESYLIRCDGRNEKITADTALKPSQKEGCFGINGQSYKAVPTEHDRIYDLESCEIEN